MKVAGLAQLPQFEVKKKFSSERGQRVARVFSKRARKHDVVPTFGTCGVRRERLSCATAEWRRRTRLYLRHSVRRKNGKQHTYWRLVRALRRGGKVVQENRRAVGRA